MAFCPNCGTPNTEQAERCVACGFELIVPKQKAKFRGTVMMSGIKAPAAGPPASPPAAPLPAAPKSVPPAPDTPPPERKHSYKKTMLGQPPVALPAKPEPPPAAPVPAAPVALGSTAAGHGPMDPNVSIREFSASEEHRAPSQPDLGATNPGGSPPMRPIENKQPSYGASVSKSTSSSSGSGRSGFNTTGSGASGNGPGRNAPGSAYESTIPPVAAPNPAKVIAVGCAAVMALFLLVGGALWLAFGDRIKALFGGDSEVGAAEAAAWQASIAQSLTKVHELCQADCAQAGVFFHPLKQAALLGEARALTAARLAKFNDPANASAAMLDRTDDSAVASQLGLDPQQCARVVSGGAKVISCSVPEPDGRPSSLRIVQLSGVASL